VGGFSTKIHAVCDALGNPLRFILSPGQQSDYKQALNLLEGFKASAILADRGYDADYIVEKATALATQAVIPSKKNRKVQRPYDTWLYKERNLVERLFNKLKNFRHLAAIYLWLK